MTLFSRGHDKGQTAGERAENQRRAIARDMRSRGLNPVTVSDVAQRHSTNPNHGRGDGRAILSRLLH